MNLRSTIAKITVVAIAALIAYVVGYVRATHVTMHAGILGEQLALKQERQRDLARLEEIRKSLSDGSTKTAAEIDAAIVFVSGQIVLLGTPTDEAKGK